MRNHRGNWINLRSEDFLLYLWRWSILGEIYDNIYYRQTVLSTTLIIKIFIKSQPHASVTRAPVKHERHRIWKTRKNKAQRIKEEKTQTAHEQTKCSPSPNSHESEDHSNPACQSNTDGDIRWADMTLISPMASTWDGSCAVNLDDQATDCH